ncbi:unnamed protein product [Pseudo-nitzschia multistriata]|uniref:GCK domain-containing protein n=1 Tax=Pseudo-nitzschia multistriata TaxID=183589 RepID=A0A448YYT3_9STRA|nr:unnamed protein product [Pseudo-nitzschia multistriata]
MIPRPTTFSTERIRRIQRPSMTILARSRRLFGSGTHPKAHVHSLSSFKAAPLATGASSRTRLQQQQHSQTTNRRFGSVAAASSNAWTRSRSSNGSRTNGSTTYFGVMASAAAATSLLLAPGSLDWNSPSTTLCEEAAPAGEGNSIPEESEHDPYDNLPEEDEPTHCSICLTYRQGPCRPYWRKVEACTKDHEKENKNKAEEGKSPSDKSKGDDDSSDEGDPSSPSERCFKYMMPWIDCASKYRNLYTLIEMDTNYTEGIQELEATSRHFCWMTGKEPAIDWTKWQEYISSKEQEDEDQTSAETTKNSSKDQGTVSDADPSVAMWKTLDTALGDPELVTIETKVPPTIQSPDGDSSGLGILECAYVTDQDNNVIGFAYGTKPSELMSDSKDTNKGTEENTTEDNKTTARSNEKSGDGTSEDGGEKMVPLNIRLVVSRTREFVLSASYTHRRIAEGTAAAAKTNGSDSSKKEDAKNFYLESHLYRSKPFSLADAPKAPQQKPTEQ